MFLTHKKKKKVDDKKKKSLTHHGLEEVSYSKFSSMYLGIDKKLQTELKKKTLFLKIKFFFSKVKKYPPGTGGGFVLDEVRNSS